MRSDTGAAKPATRRTFVVVLGRTNYVKRSGLVDSLIRDLEAAGHIVRPFRPTEQWLDERFTGSRVGPAVKRLAKLAILLRRPSRWDYLLSSAENPAALPSCDRRRLRAMIRNADAGAVCLLAHSAGGIVASLTASEPSVTRLVCFGYPFRHPERPDEPYRTAHLPSVAKPFLIVQGEQDEYGTADDARRYPLSPSTTVISVSTGHDYGGLDPTQYRACRDLVLDFVGGVSG
jgi:pimeloyl-ACP methyl ester carboxylesterase